MTGAGASRPLLLLRLAALAACAAVCCAHNTSYINTTCCSCAAAGTEPADERGSVAFAFAMSIGAGMCTTIGGAASFLGRIEDKRILAASLATSAGVMLYVSFIEIFVKSLTGFTDQFLLDGKDEAEAGRHGYYAATGFFFLGMLLTRLLDLALHRLEDAAAGETAAAAAEGKAPAGAQAAGYAEGGAATATPQACGSCDKAGRFQLDAADKLLATYDENQDGALDVKELRTLIAAVNADLKGAESESRAAAGTEAAAAAEGGITQAESARLRQMGLFTALSIFVHNFPEGLATFIATLADPAAGAALAVAIGLHNIPEGVCVGFPIYYATGSRWKAFWASFLSGLSEPIGGLVGWLLMVVLSGGNDISPLAYGIMFGIVTGMMVYIVLAHLLPAAHRYDPNDTVCTPCVTVGMVVMAASLMMFMA